MKKYYLLLIIQLLFCWSLAAQNSALEKQLTQVEKSAINSLKQLMRTRQKELIAEHIQYPLYRDKYFNCVIRNKQEFLEVFDLIFDEKQAENFCQSEWEYIFSPLNETHNLMGSRGIFHGEFDKNGKLLLTSIYLSESEVQYLQTLIEKDKKQLHESLRDYKKPYCIIFAGKYRIRIDEMPDGELRYASWNRDKPISSPADLVIYKCEVMGNRWWTSHTFKNGEFTYTFEDSTTGGLTFVVERGNRTLLSITNNISVKYYKGFYW